ncbi:MAG: sigma-E factor negative regulatory protein [Xanthomonadales bacterium]|nr:sigma-E factor negative regulatory protein [Xanthomonadales bacterium]
MSLEPKHPLDEQLSAFLDGEIDREAARFLIRRLERDPAARARLGRLAMIGACLRGETRGRPDTRLAARVAELIARECRPPARRRAWWSWPVGAALAAGVAGAVLLAGAPPVSERGTGSPAAGVVAGTADVAPGEQPAERAARRRSRRASACRR